MVNCFYNMYEMTSNVLLIISRILQIDTENRENKINNP